LVEERVLDKRYLLRLAGIGAASSLVALYLAFLGSYYLTANRIAHCERQLRAVQPRAQKVQELIRERHRTQETVEALQNVLGARQTWTGLLEDVASNLPVDTWLIRITLYNTAVEESQKNTQQNKQKEEIKLPPPDTLLIEGASLSVPSIGVTIKNLTSLGYFRRVRLEEFRRVEDGSLTFCIRAELERTNR